MNATRSANPARRVFLTAEWRYLVMVNYAVDPAVLRPRVPAGTELDLFDGAALVSMVGFRFLRTRLLGVPVPGHVDFDEVNLRFYVRHTTPDGEVRRGATFVREIVPRAAIAHTARLCYNEPYLALPMRSTAPRDPHAEPARLAYEWRGGGRDPRRWHRLEATVAGPAVPLDAGSNEEFIAEHYWGYTRQRDGATVEYQVAHPRWRAWPVRDAALDADVAGLYGPEFAEALGAAPHSAFVAEGSPVAIHFPRRLPRPARR
jgi:uncharacterized protein YqjF (DUF2071 family)